MGRMIRGCTKAVQRARLNTRQRSSMQTVAMQYCHGK